MNPRVLITREPARASELLSALHSEGIDAVARPVTCIERISDAASLPDLAQIDWVAFTSVNAVEIFAEILAESGRSLPPEVQLAAVGPATGQAVQKALRLPQVVTGGKGGADLADALREYEDSESEFTVLWPCARDSHRDFLSALELTGARVIEWPLYATEAIPAGLLKSRLGESPEFDVVVIAAPSAVRSLAEVWPVPWNFASVAIGAATAESLQKFAHTTCIVSRSPRSEDLVAAIKQALDAVASATQPFNSNHRSNS